MLEEPNLAQSMAKELDSPGIFVAPLSYPVVPQGNDRIRTKMSAAHSSADLDQAIGAFTEAYKKLEIIQ